jgi:hypothetical protein
MQIMATPPVRREKLANNALGLGHDHDVDREARVYRREGAGIRCPGGGGGHEDGSDAADDREVGILEDTPDNPTRAELLSAIEDLNDDEITEVLALVWVGRGDYGAREWRTALAAAREARDGRAAQYLLETPNFGDLLEQGLAELGYSILDDQGRL